MTLPRHLPSARPRPLFAARNWARRGGQSVRGGQVAWLSLDAGDNDPARFWRHVVAALDRVRPGTGDRVAPLLGPPAPSSFQGLVTALINDLAADEALLVEIATTIHDGTAYVFTSQNPTGSGNPSADRAAFRTFLVGIQLQR